MAGQIKNLTLIEGHSEIVDVRFETEPIVRKPITSVTSPNGCARVVAIGHGAKHGQRVALINMLGTVSALNADLDALAKGRSSEYSQATLIDADTVELNAVNAAGLVHTANTGFLQYNTLEDLTAHTQKCRVRDRKGGNLVVCSAPGTTGSIKPTKAGQDGSVTWVKLSAAELTALRITKGASYVEKVWVGSTAYSADDVVDLSVIASSDVADSPYDVLKIETDVTDRLIRLIFTAQATTILSGKTGYYDLEDVSADATPVVSALVAGTVTIVKE